MTLGLLGLALFPAAISTAVGVIIVRSQHWHGKHTLDHDLSGVQKYHVTAVPRIGGLAIFSSIVISFLLAALLDANGLSDEGRSSGWLLIAAAALTFVAGVVEDLTKRVSVKVRLGASIASALVASWLLGATINGLDIWGVDFLIGSVPAVALFVTAIVVAGGVNAINIIDGFNGLAASTVVVMLAAFAAIGLSVDDMLIVELSLLGIGATVGFLCVNYPKGRIFLGDGGAYFLGFWAAEIAVLLLVRNASVNAWQVLSVCAYPVIEIMYSMYRRKIVRKASPGAPDGLHLHTLIYRRVVPRVFNVQNAPAWKRNAAVSVLVFPVIAFAACATVIAGSSMIAAILLVLCQLVAYVAIYGRIVRGRWFAKATVVEQVAEGGVSGS